MPFNSKTKVNAYMRKYRRKHRNKFRALAQDPATTRRVWESMIKRRYALEVEDVARMLYSQGFRCFICPRTLDMESGTHIDHDHRTGRVRGLLCQRCNQALGLFDDNPSILKQALYYLTER